MLYEACIKEEVEEEDNRDEISEISRQPIENVHKKDHEEPGRSSS